MYGGGGGGEEVGGMNLPAIIIYAYTVVHKIKFCTQHTKSTGFFTHAHTLTQPQRGGGGGGGHESPGNNYLCLYSGTKDQFLHTTH